MSADVQFQIDASNRGALAALRSTKNELGAVERQSKHTGSGLRGTERDLGRVSRGALAGSGAFRHLGRSIAFASGAFLGATGFVSAVRSSISAAGDLNTQLTRSEVVFGAHGRIVKEWSRSTYQSLNLARSTALETANAFGQVLTGAGVGRARAAQEATRLARVVAAISLGRGEQDPRNAQRAALVALTGRGRALRQYGIVVDQTAIKEEAARLGLARATVASRKVAEARQRLAIETAKYNDALARHGSNSTQAASASLALQRAQDALAKAEKGSAGTLSRQQTAIAAANIVLRQGSKYTDQYAKLQNTAAGRSRAFHQGVKELQEELGTALLPAFNRILVRINNWLKAVSEGGPKHAKFVRTLHQIQSGANDAAAGIRAIYRVANLIVPVVGGWRRAFELIIGGLLINKMLKVAAAIRESRLASIAFARQSAVTTAAIEGDAAAQATAMNAPLGKIGALKTGLAGLAKSPFTIAVAVVVTGYFGNKLAKRLIGDSGSGPFGLGEGKTSAAGDLKPVLRNGRWVDPVTGRPVADQAYWDRQAAQGNVPGRRLHRSGQLVPGSTEGRGTVPGGHKSLGGFASYAKRTVGTPYHWGGTDPFHGGADCSGLVQYLYRQYWGMPIPRTSQQQFAGGRRVGSPSQVGDLIFYDGIHPGHVTMYLGGGKMIEDPHTGASVFIGPVRPGYVGVRRYLADMKGAGTSPAIPGQPSAQIPAGPGGLHVDHRTHRTTRFADPETIRIEDRRIRDEEAAIRRAARRGYITPAQERRDLRRLEALRKQLHQAHLKPAEERDIANRVARLWKNINATISAGVKKARQHAAELAKAHAKAVSDAEKVVNRAREKLGTAWDRLVSRADEAFDRVTQKGVDAISKRYDAPTPAEAALKALQDRRTALDQANALSDAQDQLALAQRLGDPQMIKEAQRAVDAAQLDEQEAGLQKQADAERAAADERKNQEIQDYEDMRQIQRDKMDDFLADLKQKLDDGTITWKDALDEVKTLLSDPANLGDFGSLGALIGGTFVQGLLDAITGTGGAADAVDRALKTLRGLGYRWNPDTGDFEKIPAGDLKARPGAGAGGGAGGVIHDPGHGAARGALITRPTLVRAGENFRREAFIPLEDERALAAVRDALGGGGGTFVTVHVHGNAIYEQDLAAAIRSQLLRTQKRNAGRLGFTGK